MAHASFSTRDESFEQHRRARFIQRMERKLEDKRSYYSDDHRFVED